MPAPNGRKLLVLEFNEINWTVIDRLIEERGTKFLPNITRLRRFGSWGSPEATERPPLLDPWITWVSVHTGVPQEQHGARVLEQDANTILAKRTWEYAADAGLSVGVFGSIGAFPPSPVNGFIVPGPFAPADNTYPPELEPVQRLNRRQTQAHGGTRGAESLWSIAHSSARLFHLGLRTSTCLTVIRQLLRERFNGESAWRRVALQPLINFDFFSRQYRRTRPDFATWHTNHAAHFMHHYWRAWHDESFATQSPPNERARFGEAVPLGYRICDSLLGQFIRLIDDRTVLLMCSSMGQQPYQDATYLSGKIIVRFKDIEEFLRRISAEGVAEIVPTMVPQVNLRLPDSTARKSLSSRLAAAVRRAASASQPAFAVQESGELLTVTPFGLSKMQPDLTYHIPDSPPFAFREIFEADAPTAKQGMHHPSGLFLAYGRGIPRGASLGQCSNLDLAPTFLSLLGLPQPSCMRGTPLLKLAA